MLQPRVGIRGVVVPAHLSLEKAKQARAIPGRDVEPPPFFPGTPLHAGVSAQEPREGERAGTGLRKAFAFATWRPPLGRESWTLVLFFIANQLHDVVGVG